MMNTLTNNLYQAQAMISVNSTPEETLTAHISHISNLKRLVQAHPEDQTLKEALIQAEIEKYKYGVRV